MLEGPAEKSAVSPVVLLPRRAPSLSVVYRDRRDTCTGGGSSY